MYVVKRDSCATRIIDPTILKLFLKGIMNNNMFVINMWLHLEQEKNWILQHNSYEL